MASTITASTTSNTALTLSSDTSGALNILTGASPTSAIYITSGQSVGVGTTSPTSPLHVTGVIRTDSGVTFTSIGTINGSANKLDINGAGASGVITFNTNAVEAMRISSAGSVLIGTASLYGGEKLSVLQSTDNRGFVIQQTNASNTSPPFLIDCSRNTTNGTYNAIGYYNSGAGAYKFYVTDGGGGYFAGNVGIANATPQGILDVGGTNGGSAGDLLVTNGSTTATVTVGRLSGTSSDNTNFRVRNRVDATAFYIDSGNKTAYVATTFGVGAATPATTGAGITFPATQSASSDANTLDDYEEGTFTPGFASSTGAITTYQSAGRYVKVGQTVTVWFYAVLQTVGTAGGFLGFSSLPFTVAGNASNYNQVPILVRETNNTGVIYFGYIDPNSTSGNVTSSTNSAVAWSNGYRYSVVVTYQTTA